MDLCVHVAWSSTPEECHNLDHMGEHEIYQHQEQQQLYKSVFTFTSLGRELTLCCFKILKRTLTVNKLLFQARNRIGVCLFAIIWNKGRLNHFFVLLFVSIDFLPICKIMMLFTCIELNCLLICKKCTV